jgi:hypothetical protein
MAGCKAATESLKDRVAMNFLGTVEYGRPLFDLLASYDVLVVPKLSNEQPRNVYDANASALPALAFPTITEGISGRLS